MASIFSRIIAGEIPCHKVAETEHFLAFLDIMPLRRGHVLVIPKKETDYIFDMDDEELKGMILFSKYVAAGIRKAIPCTKVGVSVIGLEVPHAHIHLIPIDRVEDMNFAQAKMQPSQEDLAGTAMLIRSCL